MKPTDVFICNVSNPDRHSYYDAESQGWVRNVKDATGYPTQAAAADAAKSLEGSICYYSQAYEQDSI